MALKDYYQAANYVTKTVVPNPLGGSTVVYTDGAEFKAQFNRQSVAEREVALQQGLSETMDIRSVEDLMLERDDRIKFKGTMYRVVSYGLVSPPVSSMPVYGGQLTTTGA